MQRLLTAAVALALGWIGALAPGHAQTPAWPAKPVRIIVVAAPGGSLDNSTRPLVDPVESDFASAVASDFRATLVHFRCAFEGVGELQHAKTVVPPANDLQAHR